jgi:transposase
VTKTRKTSGGRRPRRSFSPEFKDGAVRLCLDEGRTIRSVARDLEIAVSSLRDWVDRARVDRGEGRPEELTTDERKELARLRKENRKLRMEREILKKATALFARDDD